MEYIVHVVAKNQTQLSDLYFHFHRYVCNVRDFPGSSDGKKSACNAGDPRLIPGSGRSLCIFLV